MEQTKREVREMLLDMVNQVENLESVQEKIFLFLQERNMKEGTGHARETAEANYIDLMGKGVDYTYKFQEYAAAQGKVEFLRTIGIKLAALGFWQE